MVRPPPRRAVVAFILLVLVLPTVLAADMAERAASGPLVVRYADLTIGDIYHYDVSFSSMLHGLDAHVEDYMVIRVERFDDTVLGPDGAPQRAVVVSETTQRTALDDLRPNCPSCTGEPLGPPDERTTGETTTRWWLRASDGIVIRRDAQTAATEWSHEDGQWVRRDQTSNTTELSGRLASSALGIRAPDRPFVDAPALLRPFIASLWAEHADEVDVEAMMEGIDGTLSAHGRLDGRPVHRVHHEQSSDDRGPPFQCRVPFPAAGYRDFRALFDSSTERGYRDWASRNAHEHQQLAYTRESALWMSPDHAFPVLGTCEAQYHNTTTGQPFEDISFRLQLTNHTRGTTPVDFDWDPAYGDNNPDYQAPPILTPVPVRTPGAPLDDGAGLLLPLERALRFLDETDDDQVRAFHSSHDEPVHVADIMYRPNQPRDACTTPAGGLSQILPAELTDPIGCAGSYASWRLTLINSANETTELTVAQNVTAGGPSGEPWIKPTYPTNSSAPVRNAGYPDMPTHLVSLGDALRYWMDEGFVKSDWQSDRGYQIEMFGSATGSALRLRGAGSDHGWSTAIEANTGAAGGGSDYWRGAPEVTPEQPPEPTPSVAAAAVEVEPRAMAAASATASAMLLAILAYLLWPLIQKTPLVTAYAKLRRDKLLDHPVRAEMHAYLEANPGASTTDVRTALGVAQGTATHHLLKLKEHGLVCDGTVGGHRVWHLADAAPPEALDLLLQRPAVARVWETIVAHPGRTQRELADALGVAKTSIQAHTSRLAEIGALDVKRQGRTVRYWPVPGSAAPNP